MKKSPMRVLVVEDGGCLRRSLSERLTQEKLHVQETENPAQAFGLIRQQWPHVVVLATGLAEASGIEMLRQVRTLDAGLRVVMATHSPNLHEAIEAMKFGAYDYIETPSNNNEIVAAIRKACREIQRPWESSPAEEEGDWFLPRLMGLSQKVRQVADEVARVAPTNFTVVILGETGSGKELVAHAIHSQSRRAGQRFLSIDCGAIPESLIENELFGHERGAFTGADRVCIGKFEAASGGTLFLDEVSNLPLAMQNKLLRALEEKQFFRIGSTAGTKMDVRLQAATNQDLTSLIRLNAFREDLFHRLSEYIIEVPPLRERREDILFLAERFLRNANRELDKQVQGFTDSAIEMLLTYHWPGNVRELRNIVRGAVLLADEMIGPEELRFRIPVSRGISCSPQCFPEGQRSLKQIVHHNIVQIERAALLQALERVGGNKAKAARMLGIDYKTIHTKMRQYGIHGKGDPLSHSERAGGTEASESDFAAKII